MMLRQVPPRLQDRVYESQIQDKQSLEVDLDAACKRAMEDRLEMSALEHAFGQGRVQRGNGWSEMKMVTELT